MRNKKETSIEGFLLMTEHFEKMNEFINKVASREIGYNEEVVAGAIQLRAQFGLLSNKLESLLNEYNQTKSKD